MLKITASSNIEAELARFTGFERQLPFATSLAINVTAKQVKAAEETEIRRALDRPTPYTQRSVFMKPSRKTDLQAVVWLKDDLAGSGTPATAYLGPQVYGGDRGLKRFERALVRTGNMRAGQYAVPAAGARMDGYGNMSRGQIIQIISQLRAHTIAGSDQNATNSRRSRKKRAVDQYFVSHGPGSYRTAFGSRRHGRGSARQHLPAGVWLRRQTAWGSAIKPVLIFVSRVSYRARLDFFGVGNRIVERNFVPNFRDATSKALRSAGDFSGTSGFDATLRGAALYRAANP